MKQFLLFNLGSHCYSLEIAKVQEIVENPSLHFIPCAPACYCGAMNFHGEILPVLDLGIYLTGDDAISLSRILVLTPNIAALALRVETARQIISIDPLEFLPASAEEEFDFIQCKFNLEGRTISVLDLERLLLRLREDLVVNSP